MSNKYKKDILNKSDLISYLVQEHSELSSSSINEVVNVFDEIIESIALDKKVEIRGLGTFSKKHIRPRKFINPKTKVVSYIGETATLHFKVSKKSHKYS